MGDSLKVAKASTCENPAAWKETLAAMEKHLEISLQERDQLRSSVMELEEKVNQAPATLQYLRAALDDVAKMDESVAELQAAKLAKAAAQEERIELERQCSSLEETSKEVSEELKKVYSEMGSLRDMERDIEERKKRNRALRKRCEEMEAARSAELSDYEATKDQGTRTHALSGEVAAAPSDEAAL